jgi:hypothetical protein
MLEWLGNVRVFFMHNPLLIFAHVLFTAHVFLHSSLIALKVWVSLTFPSVVHLNLIVLLNFELDPPLELD